MDHFDQRSASLAVLVYDSVNTVDWFLLVEMSIALYIHMFKSMSAMEMELYQ